MRGADSFCWRRRDLVESNSEGRRMLFQGVVRIDGQPTKEETHPRDEVAGKTLSVGRRRFIHLTKDKKMYPLIRILAIGLSFAVVVMLIIAYFTETVSSGGDNPTIPYDLATNETFCEALPEGTWYRQLAPAKNDEDLNQASHDDSDTWQGKGKCGRGDDEPSGVDDPIPEADYYDLDKAFADGSDRDIANDGGKWVKFS